MKRLKSVVFMLMLVTGLIATEYVIGSSTTEAEVCPVRQCHDCRPGIQGNSNGDCRP